MTTDGREYYLLKAVLGKRPKLGLSIKEYEELVTAKAHVVRAINFEEEWDILIQNFVEFEESLLQAALNSMVITPTAGSSFNDVSIRLARKFANFLSSCRAYLDHAPHHLGAIANKEGVEVFRVSTNAAYDREFAYRFLEAIRNPDYPLSACVAICGSKAKSLNNLV